MDSLVKVYAEGNPFTAFLMMAGLCSAALTFSSDVGNIITTATSQPQPIYEQAAPSYQVMSIPNTYQKKI